MLPVRRAGTGRLHALSFAFLCAIALFALAVSLEHTDDLLCGVLNVGLLVCPLLLALACAGTPWFAAAFASLFALFIWGAGELKMHFFGDRLGLMDLYFLSESSNWNIVKRYPNVQLALVAWVGATALLIAASARLERGRPRWTAGPRLASAFVLAAWCVTAFQGRHHHTWEVFREDADCGADSICGVMSRLVFSYSAFEVLSPLPAASPARFVASARDLSPAPRAAAVGATTRPDVVVWLHESTFDPSQYQLASAELPAFTMFAHTPETRAAGKLRVHTFGGRTWLSEFSLLTSLVPDDFGARSSMVFNSVAPEVTSSLVGRFAAAGYVCIALMPTPREFYGAARTYAAVGFQRVLTLRDFPEYDNVPGDEWDIADSDRLAEAASTLLRRHREQSPERPLFLYMLSIKEHSPYDASTVPAYGLEHTGQSRVMAGRLTDYVGRLRKLDSATRALEHQLTSSERPALWAYFGDHQANFEVPSPAYAYVLPEPDLVTQYQLRANYALASAESPALLDIALLPSLIVDAAGLPTDPYFAAQSAMRRLCAGRLGDCPDQALVESYKGHVFGKEIGLFEPRAPLVAAQLP